MTTQEFINKAWYGQTRTRQCGSVFIDNGTIYSYGYHYPLLFELGGKVIRNVSGYSVSTNRHIRWTRDIDAIDIVVPSNFRVSTLDPEGRLEQLKRAQANYVQGLKAQMDAKKRKDTQVYKWLEYQYIQASANYVRLAS